MTARDAGGIMPLAIITGVGPGAGAAMARRFHDGGFQVAMLARSADRLAGFAAEMPNAFAIPCDVTDTDALRAALQQAEVTAGAAPKVVIHNAVGGAVGTFLEIDPDILARNLQINVMALLHLARFTAPRMEASGGSLIVTGNTSSRRGLRKFEGFAPSKAAQRILAESIAREMGPRGVHVAFVEIDAIIESPRMRALYPDKPDEFFIRPMDIAGEVWNLAHQPPSAWSFNVEIRPNLERW